MSTNILYYYTTSSFYSCFQGSILFNSVVFNGVEYLSNF